jgi:TRAP-type uncharacterized transport system fused permease subunit
MIGIATGLDGYMFKQLPLWERLMGISGGLMLIIPEPLTDVLGFGLIGVMVVLQILGRKKAKAINAIN